MENLEGIKKVEVNEKELEEKSIKVNEQNDLDYSDCTQSINDKRARIEAIKEWIEDYEDCRKTEDEKLEDYEDCRKCK